MINAEQQNEVIPLFLASLWTSQYCILVSLMDKVKLRKNSCKVIDVTNKRGTVETLTETKISCSLEEKVCILQPEKFPKPFYVLEH